MTGASHRWARPKGAADLSTRAATALSGTTALLAGARLAFGRLVGRPLVLVSLLALAIAAMVALVERGYEPVGAATRVLTVVFGLVVPLASFAVLSIATGRARIGETVWPLARHGLRSSHLALGLLLGVMVVAAGLAVVTVELSLVLSRGADGYGAGAAGLGRDALTSGWIAALGAAAYVAWFGLGAAFFRFGRGRWIPLVADFVLGAGAGYSAAVWPRAQLRNLIGGDGVLDLSQATSSVWLAGLIVVVTVLAALRAGD